MSGFYRNLLTRNVAMGAPEKQSAVSAGTQPEPESLPLPEGVDIVDDISAEDRAAAVKARRAEREAAEHHKRDGRGNCDRDQEMRGQERSLEGDRGRDDRRRSSHDKDLDAPPPPRGRDERSSSRRDSRQSEDHRRDRQSESAPRERSGDDDKDNRSREGSANPHDRGEKRAPGTVEATDDGDSNEIDKAKFARRNDEDRVAAARAAALARKRAGQAKAAQVQAED